MHKLELEAKKWMETKRKGKMVCPKCDTEMIQGGDHDAEDDYIVSNFSCQTCDTFLLLYWK
jgi:transposase-like protein